MKRAYWLVPLFLLFAAAPGTAQSTEPDEDDRPYEILYQPKALFPEKGRKKDLEGEVILKILLKSDGTVGEIVNKTVRHRKRLEKYGFVENAIAAARAIKFRPKMRNGEPVSILVTRSYVFTLY